jgi:hypothetical protein
LYLWILAREYNRHADIKVLLIAIMRYIPIVGIGMQFCEFIFMERNLKKDEKTIQNALEHQRRFCKSFPLWFLLFPEGQLNVPENRERVSLYCDKMKISQRPDIVLLPKSTGLFMCADGLKNETDWMFDLTIGYGGLEIEDIPYEEYAFDSVLFKDKYPKEIYIHIQKFSIASLPGMQAIEEETEKELEHRKFEFNVWLRSLYMEKNEMMREFYVDHRFSEQSISIRAKPTASEVLALMLVWASCYVTVPFLLSILSKLNILFSFYTVAKTLGLQCDAQVDHR